MNGHELKQKLAVHDQLARIYADERFPRPTMWGDLRLLALTVTWVVGIEKPELRWQRVCEIMRLDNYKFWRLIGEDAPRYEPDRTADTGLCEAPMIRRDGPCGKSGSIGGRITDPGSGEWRIASFCSRHYEHGMQAFAGERRLRQTGTLPEALPNRGGLLPCYIRWNWPDNYARARAGWTPPKVGIRADDWPTMARVIEQEPPMLKVILGGVEHDMPPIPGTGGAPSLRLLRGES